MLDQVPFFNNLSPEIRSAILRILLLILVLLIIWLSRRILTWLLIRPLRWVANRSPYEVDDMLLQVVMAPARYLIIAFGLVISAQILTPEDSINVLIQLVARSLIIIALFLLLYRLVDLLTRTSHQLFAITGISIQERLLPFARTAIKVVIGALAVVIVLQEWGYDVSGLVAGLGLFGLAFSLAAKDTAENLFGFSAIVGDSPFNVGEFISTPDVTGIIEHVGIRSTRVRQLDQALVTVPNSKLANSAVLNWSRLSKRWYNTIIGVTYAASSNDLRTLVQRIRDMMMTRDKIDPASVVVHFIEFGDSSLNILVRAYILVADWATFTAEKEAVHLEIMDIIADAGMSIAFPSRSLYIEQMPRMMEITPDRPTSPPLPIEEPPSLGANSPYTDLSDDLDTEEPPQQP